MDYDIVIRNGTIIDGTGAEGFAADASELLLEQARLAHVRGGVVPLVDGAAEGQDDESVVGEALAEKLHGLESAVAHRTSPPPRTTAAW